MARPREFDEQEVLDRALEVFWARGYEGASVADLTAATGLARASLYGAFGDKEGLYERALARYLERLDGLERMLADAPSARAGLRALFQAWIGHVCPARGPRGCFLQLSASLGPPESAVAGRLVRRTSEALERAVAGLLARGQRAGELAGSIDPPALARVLVILLQGLTAAARMGRPRRELEAAVEDALRLVPGT